PATVALLLSSLPSALAAATAGQLGFAIGSKNPDNSCKSQADFEADMAAIAQASGAKIIRIYTASECDAASKVLPAAKKQGARVVLGVWADSDKSFQADKAACVQWAPKFKEQVYAINVGSESLYRGDLNGAQLAAKVMEVKGALPGFKVGTADTWNKFQDGT